MGCESTAFEAAEGESGVDGSAQHGIGLLTKPCSGYIPWLETDRVLDKCIKTECSEKEKKDDENLVSVQCHSRQDGHRPSNHCIKTATRPQAQLKTATGQRDDGHRPSLVRPQRETRPHAVIRSWSTPWRLCVGFHSPDVDEGGGKELHGDDRPGWIRDGRPPH